MKLYATTTSERASKGQGGNEYLKIILRDEQSECFAYITVKPDRVMRLDLISEWKLDTGIGKTLEIRTNDDKKGNNQKGEQRKCECGTRLKADELWCENCDHDQNCTCSRCSSIS